MENLNVSSLVSELICFLQKWGLWIDTTILANGNRYAYSADCKNEYMGFAFVEYEENVKPEDYTTGITSEKDCCGNPIWKSYSNPEHILDMVYEGPLYMLLVHDVYETQRSEISKEAWEYIFGHTDILENFLYEEYDCFDASDLSEQILEDAKKEFMESNSMGEMIFIRDIAGYLQSEFMKIFDRCSLWYDFGFSWALTCYRKN